MSVAHPPTRHDAGQVTIVNGPSAGTTVCVGDKLTVGRRPENDLRLSDDRVSRFHAVIERRGDYYVIEDLGSKTGTTVDGSTVETARILKAESQLVLGETILHFRTPLTDGVCSSTHGQTRVQEPSAPCIASTSPFQLLPFSAVHVGTSTENQRTWAQLQTLLSLNTAISTELDINCLLDRIVDAVMEAFPAHRAIILTPSEDSGELTVRKRRSASPDAPEPRFSRTIAEQAYAHRKGILTRDAGTDERFGARISIVQENIRSAICSPITHQGDVVGVIYLDTLGVSHAFKDDDLGLLSAIAAPLGAAMHNAVLVSRLKDTAIDTVFRLAAAAEYRDGDTGFHIHRMSDYAHATARALGKSPVFCDQLKLASPMHDIGKIAIPDSILKKAGKLSHEEYEVMKQHPVKGAAILANPQSELMKTAHNIALSHHEKFNGAGYPHGLSGDHIPLEARIVAVADVFDALSSPRCYKPAFDQQKAFGILLEGRATHFDPEVLDAFMDHQEDILAIQAHYRKLEFQTEVPGEDGGPYDFGHRSFHAARSYERR